MAFGLAIIIPYAFTKNWILSNIIATLMTFVIFQMIRIPSMKVAALLLGLAFFYDIFWVFLSPMIFGQSVMATVATGVDLPMKLSFPILKQLPIPRCSLIGLGDIVLPGIFIGFCYRFANS